MSADIIPQVFNEYIAQPRWIDWKYELKGGKQNKSPINPKTGQYASSTDPQTWDVLSVAREGVKRFNCTGFGIILGRGLGGIDLDACRNPETGVLTSWAMDLIKDFKSYTEISPSKTGVKIWATGAPATLPANSIAMNTPPIKGKTAKVEVFTHSRYFAVTGEVLDMVPDEIANGEESGAWARLIAKLHAPNQSPKNGTGELSEHLKKALQQHERLRTLWASGKDGGADRSRNDAALAATLGALGYPDSDVEAALRHYPFGQIGQGSLTGTTASRQIIRLLGLASAARQKRNEPAITIQESELRQISEIKPAVQYLYKTGLQPGESPGWPSLRSLWTLRAGEWTLITGMPSHGKSSFADAVMVNLAKLSNWNWAVWSGENLPHETHIANLLEQYTGKPFNDGHTARMTSVEVNRALEFLDDHFVFLSPPEDQETPARMLAIAEQAMKSREIHGLLLDPWNELTHNYIEQKQSETEYISQELKRIRRFAARHHLHVIIVAHPRKMQKEDGKYPIPTPYDVSSSAHWRNKADCALCVWRDESKPGETMVYVQKIRRRFVGRIGNAQLSYDVVTGRFTDPMERKWRDPGEEG